MSLGRLRLDNRLLCAPMAGVSDRTFRRLVREAGCALAFPEMVSDKALLWGNEKTTALVTPYPGERPYAVQLLGREPEQLARAAMLVVDRFGAELVDINMGCPVPKVVRNREGASLLREPALCAEIIETVRQAVRVPVSCKLRLGWDQLSAVEVAQAVEEAGAAFITVHGRLRSQDYSVPADWGAIAAVAAAVSVPVVGNGDVLTPPAALRMLAETGCQGVMVGRGALGNPWIFERSLRLARTGDPGPGPSATDRVGMALRHLELAAADKRERLAVLEMRHHGSWYIRGLPGAAAVRARLMRTDTITAAAALLREYLASLATERGG